MAHWLHRAELKGQESGKLFPRVSLMSTNKFEQIVKASMKRWFPTKVKDWNKDRISVHSFRHSGATILVDGGYEESSSRIARRNVQEVRVSRAEAGRGTLKAP
ncbi:hypothetical protein FOZ61_008754 [Perkinsus olseni]|uniref:Uncharacterized protein n=1 Tax=Perkinsus olseni TaxID=32597 RepID=A0A7J6L271_PEROL|nr:hypothetical protein FOZ61_008754 [Perkinsus olseni]